ncbi:phosphoribosyl-ATP diphosphatase [Pelagibius sp. 7325]|uniref:phosphoribosyl-ATP diphosphatase n=1 Tax=Pelagibius sp. 7325 TaxID=3131994 RepID=UPI0030EC61A7
MSKDTLNGSLLDTLYAVIESRRGADPESSHTARLFSRGIDKICQKVGEEAVETVIEGAQGRKEGVVGESADLLYHLLVLWAASGVKPAEVWAALEGRKGISGIAEKASRKQD